MNNRVRFSLLEKAESAVESLSRSGRILFYSFAAVCAVSALALVYLLNSSVMVATPARGGSLTEGVLGSPRFINPVLAVSEADRDLTTLVFAGLLRATPEGTYTPDLAESYTVSDDGTIYTFILKSGLTFQDGTPLTADDVLFTIQKTQDPALKSPARANWDGVVVEKVDDRTIKFTLKSPYAPFLENLTLGVIPKARWQEVSDDEFPFSELNTSPIGAGPFKVQSIARSSAGIPSSYTLSPFSSYALGQPYLTLTLQFYQDEDTMLSALRAGDLESASGLSPASLQDISGSRIMRSPLSRVFGIFFNQNQSIVLRDASVRDALNSAVDRKALVDAVLKGYGTPLDGPLPSSKAAPTPTGTDLVAAAAQNLAAHGWKVGLDGVLAKTTGSGKTASTVQLAFTISTGNVPELRAAAEYVKNVWTKLGAKVDVQVYEQGDLSQNVIRPRKYDALLFGEVIGRGEDLFAFWHSSQRNDPGLNIAMYANANADKLLSSARTEPDASKRADLLSQFETTIAQDDPAVFLYAPDFVYTVPNDLEGLKLGVISDPSDRFLTAALWHRQVEYVWPFFVQTKNK